MGLRRDGDADDQAGKRNDLLSTSAPDASGKRIFNKEEIAIRTSVAGMKAVAFSCYSLPSFA
jgi:hypothetical protein